MKAVAIALGVVLAPAPAQADGWVSLLDRTTPLAGELVVRGELRSSLDGSTFDAITQRDRYPQLPGAAAVHVGGLFDATAGGLRVIEQDPAAHVYRLAPDGSTGPGCAAAGVPSPCLVPRLRLLALERLVTAETLAATLAGTLTADVVPLPAPPLLDEAGGRAMASLLALAALLAGVALGLALRRARRATTMGQVYVAAAHARRAIRGDATLGRVREQIEALVVRAEELESARRACTRRLAALDPTALTRKREAFARSTAPDAAAALAMLTAESAEADTLAADQSSAAAGLERIASSLRALALRTRADRGTQAAAPTGDPVEALLGELDLRELALREAGRGSRG